MWLQPPARPARALLRVHRCPRGGRRADITRGFNEKREEGRRGLKALGRLREIGHVPRLREGCARLIEITTRVIGITTNCGIMFWIERARNLEARARGKHPLSGRVLARGIPRERNVCVSVKSPRNFPDFFTAIALMAIIDLST